MDLDSPRPMRVVAYLARVTVNGPLFGLMRRSELLAESGFLKNRRVARMAARGRAVMLRDVHVHRSMTGLGSRDEETAVAWSDWTVGAPSPSVGGSPPVVCAAGRGRVVVAARAAALSGDRASGRAGLGALEPRVAACLRARER
jgi:hypothetical protein